ncbi:MAG: UDP-N-acetylmuramate dehydrogenase [Saprospiraceae bacterium]|nr:UDP-N-acetylmuramate dehydrogenase [Saprospiraceae bacterium]
MTSLKLYNSFGIDVQAHQLIPIRSREELQSYDAESLPRILGGGTNILLTKNMDDPVLKIEIADIEILDETSDDILIRFGAGLNWHEMVMWSIEQGYGGLENLSLIPGTVGAAPVQNIGAYGVEIKDVLEWIEGYNFEKRIALKLNREDCQLDYRNSIFKSSLKNKFAISHVVLRLNKMHKLHLEYGAIKEVLRQKNIEDPTIRQVSEAVIEIRKSKLPDPGKLGNAGSFFKNSTVTEGKFLDLKKQFPSIQAFPMPDGRYKLATGWMIEYCGWKGKKMGHVGCYEKQALVIVNYGNASGQEIYDFSIHVARSVYDTFGVQLETEVNIW